MTKNNRKIPIWLTIDFEDFTHDYLRSIKNKSTINNNVALWKSYEEINKISTKYLNDKKITFFVTAVLARSAPNLIKRIYDDGHEIACHYNFHDDISKQNKETLSTNIDLAIKSIEDITGERPIGFRAPFFSIRPENTWAYKIIFDKFIYDSSYKTSLNFLESNIYLNNNNIKSIGRKEYFIYKYIIPFTNFGIKSGGTFLRFFPVKLIEKCLVRQYDLGHTPVLYMHPYELTLKSEFWIDYKFFRQYSLIYALILWARQIQWLKIGHKSLDKKLNYIFQRFEHQGRLKDISDLND